MATSVSRPHVLPEAFRDFTGRIDTGQMAARNSLKVLNHMDLLRDYERVAAALGFRPLTGGHSAVGKDGPAHQTPEILDRHQRREIRTGLAIQSFSEKNSSESETMHALRSLHGVAQVEFHPCDVCNEACLGCTYGHDDPALKPPRINFPLESLGRLAEFQPRAMVVTGGGEPLLYRDRTTATTFPGLMDALVGILPGCQFGLISNGTLYPSGDWPDRFRWIRFSVDASSPDTYLRQRGRPFFNRVCENLTRLFRESSVPRIGVGFVFSSGNIHEAVDSARFFFDLIRTECPTELSRLNIQYRPLRRDREDAGRRFPQAVSRSQIEDVERDLICSAEDPDFFRFLQDQTNCEALAGGTATRQSLFRVAITPVCSDSYARTVTCGRAACESLSQSSFSGTS